MKKPDAKETTQKKGTEKELLHIDFFSVNRAKMLDNGHVTFDITINGITIYGCFVVESEKGDFISLPQRKGNDGKYYSIAWARFSEQDTKDIIAEVEKKLND